MEALRLCAASAARLRVGAPSTLNPAAHRFLAGLGLSTGAPIEIAWEPGRGFVWEDSVCHEVIWRETPRRSSRQAATMSDQEFLRSEPRIVLLLLLLHPAMTRQRVCIGR